MDVLGMHLCKTATFPWSSSYPTLHKIGSPNILPRTSTPASSYSVPHPLGTIRSDFKTWFVSHNQTRGNSCGTESYAYEYASHEAIKFTCTIHQLPRIWRGRLNDDWNEFSWVSWQDVGGFTWRRMSATKVMSGCAYDHVLRKVQVLMNTGMAFKFYASHASCSYR